MKSITAKFLTSAADPKFFPPEGPPEFAFLGRSNVGKSSLINSLLGQKLAHVSSTPGRTRTINFIGIYAKPSQPHPEMLLVDLPGYGYAKLSKEISAEWPKFIEPYLQERETLALSIVLIDSNVLAQAPDRHLIDFLRSAGRDFLVVATDRKSTRLNSSHTVISYAVFCLKKKKKTKSPRSTWRRRAASTGAIHMTRGQKHIVRRSSSPLSGCVV